MAEDVDRRRHRRVAGGVGTDRHMRIGMAREWGALTLTLPRVRVRADMGTRGLGGSMVGDVVNTAGMVLQAQVLVPEAVLACLLVVVVLADVAAMTNKTAAPRSYPPPYSL